MNLISKDGQKASLHNVDTPLSQIYDLLTQIPACISALQAILN